MAPALELNNKTQTIFKTKHVEKSTHRQRCPRKLSFFNHVKMFAWTLGRTQIGPDAPNRYTPAHSPYRI